MSYANKVATVKTLKIADLAHPVGPAGASEAVGALPCVALAAAAFIYSNSNR